MLTLTTTALLLDPRAMVVLKYAELCVNPVLEYFKSKFDPSRGELRETLLAFKASRYLISNQLRPSPHQLID